MRGFGRRYHVTKELVVFGHMGTKVHLRRCFLQTNLAEGNIKSTYLGDFFAMPGANCSIYGCTTSRKHSEVGIFKIPAETDELSKKTCKAWTSMITKDHVVDESLRRQINSGNLYVCESILEKKNVSAVSIFISSCFYLPNIARLTFTYRCAAKGHGP